MLTHLNLDTFSLLSAQARVIYDMYARTDEARVRHLRSIRGRLADVEAAWRRGQRRPLLRLWAGRQTVVGARAQRQLRT